MNKLNKECDYCGKMSFNCENFECSLACPECLEDQPEHGCPYQEEINEDHEWTCTCSEAQQDLCRMEI